MLQKYRVDCYCNFKMHQTAATSCGLDRRGLALACWSLSSLCDDKINAGTAVGNLCAAYIEVSNVPAILLYRKIDRLGWDSSGWKNTVYHMKFTRLKPGVCHLNAYSDTVTYIKRKAKWRRHSTACVTYLPGLDSHRGHKNAVFSYFFTLPDVTTKTPHVLSTESIWWDSHHVQWLFP